MNVGRVHRAWKRLIWAPIRSRIYPEVETQIDERRIRIDLRDHIIGRTMYVYGAYEPELQRLIRGMNLNGAACIDIGANIGVYRLGVRGPSDITTVKAVGLRSDPRQDVGRCCGLAQS